ncbi:uncharacterized protein RCC_09497 [Ramularia collo-cygni]|uniref:Uncharacterized protein n=1 Tax=Ramularia collo-cygni TaxID=112498 RepID=A0A2D3V718_9PEZI|nr:uncharacterized protein RCC_09497 [Ramularia collo-cygni]CZT23783.1 uncharacterized protein RCC_09497 [Ramularia collo-cygni]
MNLFEAIIDQKWPRRFRLWLFVIHCCCRPNRVALGEIFFTRLYEGYIFNARRFSSYSTGVSVFSVYSQKNEAWSSTEDWVLNDMLLRQTKKTEERKQEAVVKKVRAETNTMLKQIVELQEEIEKGEERLA